nr:type I methionyl aminopeptidase [Angustibacter aerolatus]
MLGRERIQYKSPDEVRAMRRAGLVVGETLELLRERVRPGLTTAEARRPGRGAHPAQRRRPLVHRRPDRRLPRLPGVAVRVGERRGRARHPGERVLQPGDVVSIDCGAVLDGWHGDAAITVALDPADPADTALLRVTEDAMWQGIAALGVGRRLFDVGAAVEDRVAAADGTSYGIVEDYVGHGIGTEMHQDPQVPNYRVRDKGVRVKAGLAVAIEPMLTRGDADTRVLDDGWTVVTVDGSRAAHFEHSVAVGEAGLWVLTALDGGAARLAELGVPFAPSTGDAPDHLWPNRLCLNTCGRGSVSSVSRERSAPATQRGETSGPTSTGAADRPGPAHGHAAGRGPGPAVVPAQRGAPGAGAGDRARGARVRRRRRPGRRLPARPAGGGRLAPAGAGLRGRPRHPAVAGGRAPRATHAHDRGLPGRPAHAAGGRPRRPGGAGRACSPRWSRPTCSRRCSPGATTCSSTVASSLSPTFLP